jgi:hypothetical protein
VDVASPDLDSPDPVSDVEPPDVASPDLDSPDPVSDVEPPDVASPDVASPTLGPPAAVFFVGAPEDRRSFLAQPLPLKWIVGGANARVTAPSQSGHW